MSNATHKIQSLLAVSRRAIADRHHSSAYIGEIATIEVGTGANKKTFYVYRDFLSFYSGYFRAALNGGFSETGSGVIQLESEEPAVFEGFVRWLYTSRAREDTITAQSAPEYFTSIVKLWLFADRREIPLLMNEMINSLHRSVVAVRVLPTNTLEEIYANTTGESALRRFVVDAYASLGSGQLAESILEDNKEYAKIFLVDWIKSLTATDPRRPPLSIEQYAKAEPCHFFHVHEEGVHCPFPRRRGFA